ncbi:uncharacterized protein LOC144709928 [Wolffia australiana]
MVQIGIVAICQYGGKFISNEDGSMSYVGGDAHAIDLNTDLNLEDFKSEIMSLFDIDVTAMSIKYFLPNNRQTLITVSSDKDLHRMIDFHANSTTVDVYILDKDLARLSGGLLGSSGNSANVSGRNAKRRKRVTADMDSYDRMISAAPPSFPSLLQTDDEGQGKLVAMENLGRRGGGAGEMELSAMAGSGGGDGLIIPGPSVPAESIITGVGQEFDNVKDLRAKLFQYAMRRGFAYKFVKSELTRVTARCVVESCPWRLHASKSSYKQKIVIKILNGEHSCGCGGGGEVQPKATKKWLVDVIKDKLRDSPLYKTKEILRDVSEEYGIHLKYYQVWRGKTDAQKELLNLHEEAYNQLPVFCEKILNSNPGSIVTLATSADLKFRIFVAFRASLHGFEYGCRPLVFLDRVPLKENTHLKLLAAAAVDGDNAVFPVAFAAVEAESPESWAWFLEQLRFAVGAGRTLTFVSDRGCGLEEAVGKAFGDCFHALCLAHLVEDFKAELNRGPWSQGAKDAMVEELERAAQSPHAEELYARVDCVRGISEEAAAWIMAAKPERWAASLFKGARYGHCSADAVESLSAWIPPEREMSVVLMIDALRAKMAETVDLRRQAAAAWPESQRLTPSMEQRLAREAARAHKLGVLRSSENVFEVRGSNISVVDTAAWECSCGRWQLAGLPCAHAVAVAAHLGRSVYDLCSHYLRAETYRVAYAESVYPIPDVDKISSSFGANIPAPRNRRPRTLLRQLRDHLPPAAAAAAAAAARGHHCSRCKGSGHNKATCKALL